jgi:hypothetical protein
VIEFVPANDEAAVRARVQNQQAVPRVVLIQREVVTTRFRMLAAK